MEEEIQEYMNAVAEGNLSLVKQYVDMYGTEAYFQTGEQIRIDNFNRGNPNMGP